LIPASSFFEWRSTPTGKEPVMFSLHSGELFAFAGLWERWYGPRDAPLDEPLESVTILTTSPNDLTRRVHDRMPVILPRDAWDLWLQPDELPAAVALEPLVSYDARAMQAHIVSRIVNKVGHNAPECVEPIAELV
jgi:putative SOS response-associated peptidase YedK